MNSCGEKVSNLSVTLIVNLNKSVNLGLFLLLIEYIQVKDTS